MERLTLYSKPLSGEFSDPCILIIGAGPAGLTCAYELLRQTNIRPVILESSSKIGGISRTEYHNGNRIDLGGHRFFSRSALICKIWEDMLPVQGSPAWDDRFLKRQQDWVAGGPDPDTDDSVMLIRDRVSRIYFNGKFFDYPVSLSFKTCRNLGFKRVARIGVGYIRALFIKRQEHSLEDFYINRFGKPLYELFFESYTEKLWGIHPSKIAPDWGAQRVKGLSLGKAIFTFIKRQFVETRQIETSLIEKFQYPKYGPGQLWERMAEKIVQMGGQIVLDANVTQIIQKEDLSFSAYTTSGDENRREYHGAALFSSMPIKDLVTALNPAPPQDLFKIATDLPYRDFLTVGLLVDRLKISSGERQGKLDLIPDCWIYIQDKSVKIGRLQVFNNWSPYMVADPENTVWIGLEYFCREGDDLWSLPDDQMADFGARELQSIGVLESPARLDHIVLRVPKAYPAYFGSYSQFGIVQNYLDQIPGLFCIGRNGQHRYNNMDHSMLTAIEAAHCYINQSDKHAIWEVNTEKLYGG